MGIVFLIYTVVPWLVQLYTYCLIIYCLLSWLPRAYNTTFGQIIIKLTEPYMSKFRKLPLTIMGLDFTPLVAIFLLQLAQKGFFIVVSWFL